MEERYQKMRDQCLKSLQIWQGFIRDHLENEDQTSEFTKLKNMAMEYCLIDNNHKKSQQALNATQEHIEESDNKDLNVDQIFKTAFANQEDEEPTKNEIWQTLLENNSSICEIKQKKKKDKSHYEQVAQDDSLLCSSSFTAPIDPISKVVIRNPVRNSNCNHVYEKSSIFGYIRQSKSKAKCPYMGCNNNRLVPEDLKEDGALMEQISQHLASQQQEESDDESDSD